MNLISYVIEHLMKIINSFGNIIYITFNSFREPEFQALLVLVFFVLGLGALAYHMIEGWNYLDSLYFSVSTLTTVGYGDYYSKTDAGKIFTIFYVLFGIGIIFTLINTLAKKTQKKNVIWDIYKKAKTHVKRKR